MEVVWDRAFWFTLPSCQVIDQILRMRKNCLHIGVYDPNSLIMLIAEFPYGGQ